MKNCIVACILLWCFFGGKTQVDAVIVSEAKTAQGGWEQGTLRHRNGIKTEVSAQTVITTHIPQTERYVMFGYIFHEWKKHFARIDVEAIDSQGKVHTGSHCIENIWYMNECTNGRWFFCTLSDNPYWLLPSGPLTITLRATGQRSAWESTEETLEGAIAIDTLFLVPSRGERLSAFGAIEASDISEWTIDTYVSEYGTNTISSERNGAVHTFSYSIPETGLYQGIFSVLSKGTSKIKVSVHGEKSRKKIELFCRESETWSTICTEPFYLRKGVYTVIIKDSSSKRTPHAIYIDYAALFPV